MLPYFSWTWDVGLGAAGQIGWRISLNEDQLLVRRSRKRDKERPTSQRWLVRRWVTRGVV